MTVVRFVAGMWRNHMMHIESAPSAQFFTDEFMCNFCCLPTLAKNLQRKFTREGNMRKNIKIAIIAVTLLGLLTIYSSSSGDMSLVIKQFTRIVIGIVTMIFIAQVHPDNLRLFAPPLYFFTLLLLILVLFFGVGNTADRWLDLYFIRFQPSELMKRRLVIKKILILIRNTKFQQLV